MEMGERIQCMVMSNNWLKSMFSLELIFVLLCKEFKSIHNNWILEEKGRE